VCETFGLLSENEMKVKRKSNGGKTNIILNNMQNDEIFIKRTWFQMGVK
jgi:glycine betaine/choline ABC-type transport system substrate-binding protein